MATVNQASAQGYFPHHTLASAFLLRQSLARAAGAIVDGCYTDPEPSVPPLVACARHKAVARAAALDLLVNHEAVAQQRLESNRDAAVAEAEAFIAEIRAAFDARSAELRRVADSKRAGLQAEAVAVDAALENAQAVTAALLQVRYRKTRNQPATIMACACRLCRLPQGVTTQLFRY